MLLHKVESLSIRPLSVYFYEKLCLSGSVCKVLDALAVSRSAVWCQSSNLNMLPVVSSVYLQSQSNVQ